MQFLCVSGLNVHNGCLWLLKYVVISEDLFFLASNVINNAAAIFSRCSMNNTDDMLEHLFFTKIGQIVSVLKSNLCVHIIAQYSRSTLTSLFRFPFENIIPRQL